MGLPLGRFLCQDGADSPRGLRKVSLREPAVLPSSPGSRLPDFCLSKATAPCGWPEHPHGCGGKGGSFRTPELTARPSEEADPCEAFQGSQDLAWGRGQGTPRTIPSPHPTHTEEMPGNPGRFHVLAREGGDLCTQLHTQAFPPRAPWVCAPDREGFCGLHFGLALSPLGTRNQIETKPNRMLEAETTVGRQPELWG